MYRFFAVLLLAVLFSPESAVAQGMTEKQKCLRGVLDVRETMASAETPEPGAKIRAEVENLLEVSTHLCEQGNFVYAGKLLELARGLVVSE